MKAMLSKLFFRKYGKKSADHLFVLVFVKSVLFLLAGFKSLASGSTKTINED
jgi:hypothetical protein